MSNPFTIWTRAHTYPRVLVSMFFPPTSAAMGDVLSTYIPITANAIGTPGWGVHTPQRSGAMDQARTKACVFAIQRGYTHLLMLDNDHIHPANIARQLLAHGKDVVGGLNFMRGYPHRACASSAVHIVGGELEGGRQHALHLQPIQHTGLQKVVGIGTGSLLIRLEVLKKLKQPWFYFPYHDIDFNDLDQPWAGEDGGFSIRCGRAGVEMWCDTECTSPHLANNWIDHSDCEP